MDEGGKPTKDGSGDVRRRLGVCVILDFRLINGLDTRKVRYRCQNMFGKPRMYAFLAELRMLTWLRGRKTLNTISVTN